MSRSIKSMDTDLGRAAALEQAKQDDACGEREAGLASSAPETEPARQYALSRIERALDRMARGEYGYCIACGDEVSLETLETDPATALCHRCEG